MSRPSDTQVSEWLRLAEAATPGEWRAVPRGEPQPSPLYRWLVALVSCEPGLSVVTDGRAADPDRWEADARLIAAARTAVPILCAEVARLRAHLEVLRSDVATALAHRRNRGGQRVSPTHVFASVPPSALVYLERLVRDALGEEPSNG